MAKIQGDQTGYKGQIVGDNRAAGGMLQGIPINESTKVRSDWECFYQTFYDDVASITEMEKLGWAETQVTGAGPTIVGTKEEGFLALIGVGDDADEGTNIQLISANATDPASVPHKSIGPLTSTPTLMDNRSLICSTRVRFQPASAFSADGPKFVFGWLTTDTAIMTPGTGALAIATGGGIGFHMGETGTFSSFYQSTTVDDVSVDTGFDLSVIAASQTWWGLGTRIDFLDASEGTGTMRWYIQDENAGTPWREIRKVVGTGSALGVPMQSTQVYGVSFALINGATVDADLHISEIFTAITKPGRTA